MKTLVVIRDGKIQLNVSAEEREGIIWTKSGPLVNRDLVPEGQKDRIVQHLKAGDITDEIKSMCMVLGDNGNGARCLWLDDYEEEKRTERAARMYPRTLDVSGNGKIVLVHDTRDEITDQVDHAGCRWLIADKGRSFERGDHTVQYAYLQFEKIIDGQIAYQQLDKLLRQENDRYRSQFNRMMEDENNDGANPPRQVCGELKSILKQISHDDIATVDLRKKVERAVEGDNSTTTGCIRRKYAEKALEMLNAGSPAGEVEATLEAYQNDPDYAEAVLSM